MTLTERQKKHLRKLGHELHPIVLVGQRGMNPGVVEELKLALEHHELVKLRVRVGRPRMDGMRSSPNSQSSRESEFVYPDRERRSILQEKQRVSEDSSAGFLIQARRTASTSKPRVPPGAATSTSSPGDFPINARAIGELIDTRP